MGENNIFHLGAVVDHIDTILPRKGRMQPVVVFGTVDAAIVVENGVAIACTVTISVAFKEDLCVTVIRKNMLMMLLGVRYRKCMLRTWNIISLEGCRESTHRIW